MHEKDQEHEKLFSDPEFIKAYSNLIAERVSTAKKKIRESEPEVISQSIISHKGRLTKFRTIFFYSTYSTLALSLISLLLDFSIFLNFILSSLAVISGLILSIILFAEIVSAAGLIDQKELKLGDDYKRTFSFTNSISSISELLKILFSALIAILVGFGDFYLSMSRYEPRHFSETLNFIGSLYFSIVTFATVGYGDISAVSDMARFVVFSEIFISFLFISIVLTTTISWVVGTQKSRVEEILRDKEQSMYETERAMKAAKVGHYSEGGGIN